MRRAGLTLVEWVIVLAVAMILVTVALTIHRSLSHAGTTETTPLAKADRLC
jgi:Tfp pilus assembly protein PilE